MNNITLPKFLFWSPRVLGILFSIFLALFALDAFNQNQTPFSQVVGFMVQLTPAVLIFIFTLIGWKWKTTGAVMLALVGLFFTLYFHTYLKFLSFSLVSFPVFLISLLFFLDKHNNKDLI